MIPTLQWKDVFCQLDQWDALPKLRAIHREANSSITATWLARLCSPNVAYLVVDMAGEIQLFHHFHHDVNDGLNDGTNQLWALQGGSSMAHAVSIRPDQLNLKQRRFAIEWTTMTAWNSTDDILAEVERRVKAHASIAAKANRSTASGRSAKALASTAKTTRQTTTSKGRKRLVKPSDDEPVTAQDSEGDVEIVEAPFAPIVPIPAFITATLMEDYESDPIELCWQTRIEGICRRAAAADDDDEDASRLAEVSLYVPQWLFSTAINVRLAANSSTPFGVANCTARHLRMDAWTQGVHCRHLAVRARSIIGADAATRSGSGSEDVIRNLSSILERQVATGVSSSPPEKSPFDAFPPTTRQLVLFASELTPNGMAPTRPIKSFMEALALTNVAFMQNHMHNFLRHSSEGAFC
jgi:hypothetical protein